MGKQGALLGWIPLFGSLGIAIGYSVILGWVLRSLFGVFTGNIFNSNSGEFFSQISSAFSNIPDPCTSKRIAVYSPGKS